MTEQTDRTKLDSQLERLEETLAFFRFARLQGSGYRGSAQFRLKDASQHEVVKTVRVSPETGVQIIDGQPEDGRVSCTMYTDFDSFLDCYSGEIHPTQPILAGKIRVSSCWNLRSFCNAFDFSTQSWNQFYESDLGAQYKPAPVEDTEKEEDCGLIPRLTLGEFQVQQARLAAVKQGVSSVSSLWWLWSVVGSTPRIAHCDAPDSRDQSELQEKMTASARIFMEQQPKFRFVGQRLTPPQKIKRAHSQYFAKLQRGIEHPTLKTLCIKAQELDQRCVDGISTKIGVTRLLCDTRGQLRPALRRSVEKRVRTFQRQIDEARTTLDFDVCDPW